MPINVIHVGDNDIIDYTPSTDVAAGEVVVLNDLLGVALSPLQGGRPGALMVWGMVDAPKASGNINAGVVVYWDATNKVVTTSATGNKRAGITAEASNGPRIKVLWGR